MKSTKFAIASLVFIFLFNIYPGFFYDWFARFDYFDNILHFLGGFFVAMLIFSYYNTEFQKNSQMFKLFALVGMAAGIGVIWEFSEFIANQVLVDPLYKYFGIHGYFIGDLNDTISDLLNDILGAISYFSLHFLWSRNSNKRKRLS